MWYPVVPDRCSGALRGQEDAPHEVVTTGDVKASPLLRWYASGDFHERPMRASERDYFQDQEYRIGYVKPRHPETMR